jgi:glycosyltransferase involved in cell wall biosynthesis
MTVTVGSPAAGYRLKADRDGRSIPGVVFRMVAWVTERIEAYLDARSTVLFAPGEQRAASTRHGIAFSTASYSESDISYREDSVAGGAVTWIHVGNISYEKGVDTFLEALAEVRQEADHRALLLGALNPRFDLDGYVSRLGLTASVRVAGRLPWTEALQEMRRASMLVFLSRQEGMPKAPMEAMSQGLPVIATPTGAEQFVLDGVNGIVVPVGDPGACARAVLRLVSNPSLRRSLIEGGYATARSHSYEASLLQVRTELCRRLPTLTSETPALWHVPGVVDPQASSSGSDSRRLSPGSLMQGPAE